MFKNILLAGATPKYGHKLKNQNSLKRPWIRLEMAYIVCESYSYLIIL